MLPRLTDLDKHWKLVPYMVKRLIGTKHPLYEDALSEGFVGLLEAQRKWKSGLAPFHLFAIIYIRGRILQFLRNEKKFQNYLVKEGLVKEETNWEEIFEEFDPRTAQILLMKFKEGYEASEIAFKLGLSDRMIRLILQQALERMEREWKFN